MLEEKNYLSVASFFPEEVLSTIWTLFSLWSDPLFAALEVRQGNLKGPVYTLLQ